MKIYITNALPQKQKCHFKSFLWKGSKVFFDLRTGFEIACGIGRITHKIGQSCIIKNAVRYFSPLKLLCDSSENIFLLLWKGFFFFVEFHKIEFSVKQSTEKYCEFWWEHQHFGYYYFLRHPYILYYFIYWKFKVPITCFIYSYFQSNNFINLSLFTEIYIKTIVTYLLQAKFIVKSSFISYFWIIFQYIVKQFLFFWSRKLIIDLNRARSTSSILDLHKAKRLCLLIGFHSRHL